MAIIGIYGAGGCGRGVLPLARAQYGEEHEICFIDDDGNGGTINDQDVYGFDAFCNQDANEKLVSLAIANGAIREKLAGQCEVAGIGIIDIMAKRMVVMDDVEIGEGAIFSPFTSLTSNIRIGRHFHCNLYSYVEHDCEIGDFVTFAPAVRCNGNVKIGDRAYVGSGAVIRQGITIGDDAVVGMGAIVVKDVPAGVTVIGNPALPMASS